MPYKKEKRKEYYERHKKYYDAAFKKLHKNEWNKYQNEYKKTQRTIGRIKGIVNDLNIDEEGTLTYKAVIIFFCLLYNFSKAEIQKRYKYSAEEVDLIISNWMKCGVYKDGCFIMESDIGTFESVLEISLIAMAGTGQIVRYEL